MTDTSEAIAKIARALAAYPALVCPSEMWRMIAEALDPATAMETLDSLPAQLANQLQETYLAMPPICYSESLLKRVANTPQDITCNVVVDWCEKRVGGNLI